MHNMDHYYDNQPDSFKERRKKRKKVYSSNEYVHGIKGKLMRLMVCFTFYLVALCIQLAIGSVVMPLASMGFIFIAAVTLMVMTFLITLLRTKNFVHLFGVLAVLAALYLLSPYGLWMNIKVMGIYAITTFILLARLKKPERIALSPTTVVLAAIFIGIIQLLFYFDEFISPYTEQVKQLLFIISVLWVVLTIFLLNTMNLHRQASDRKETSSALFSGNLKLTIIFAIVALGVASIGVFRSWITENLRRLLLAFLMLFQGKEGQVLDTPPQGGNMDLSGLGEKAEPSLFWIIFEKVIAFLLIVGLAILAFYILKHLIKVLRHGFLTVMDYLSDRDDMPDGHYEDEISKMKDETTFGQGIKKGWQRLKKAFKRKPTFADMRSNKERVRFLYRSLRQRRDPEMVRNETAREFIGGASAGAKAFTEGYEEARYSTTHDVSDDAVTAGKDILQEGK